MSGGILGDSSFYSEMCKSIAWRSEASWVWFKAEVQKHKNSRQKYISNKLKQLYKNLFNMKYSSSVIHYIFIILVFCKPIFNISGTCVKYLNMCDWLFRVICVQEYLLKLEQLLWAQVFYRGNFNCQKLSFCVKILFEGNVFNFTAKSTQITHQLFIPLLQSSNILLASSAKTVQTADLMSVSIHTFQGSVEEVRK